jgi:hypothetical protein
MQALFVASNSVCGKIQIISDLFWSFPTNFEWYANLPIIGNFSLAVIRNTVAVMRKQRPIIKGVLNNFSANPLTLRATPTPAAGRVPSTIINAKCHWSLWRKPNNVR